VFAEPPKAMQCKLKLASDVLMYAERDRPMANLADQNMQTEGGAAGALGCRHRLY